MQRAATNHMVGKRQRRSHLKSRNGCVACKRRHQKCDEVLPRCSQCTRLNTKCSLEDHLDTQGPTPISQNQVSATTLFTFDDIPRSAAFQHPIDKTDLEIYNNWIMYTAFEVFPIGGAASGLLRRITQLVLCSPYLLHGAMAISALQMYFTDLSRDCLLFRASYLQSIALREARPHIASLSEDESIPMLFFSGFTATYGLAEGSLRIQNGANETADAISMILQSFQLVRGVKTILKPHWRYLKESWIAPILHLALTSGIGQEAPTTTLPDQGLLRSLALGLDAPNQRQSCLSAINLLSQHIQVAQHCTDHFLSARIVMAWPTEVDSNLEDLIIQHKPIGLVIMAYYAVLLHSSRSAWWVSKWPSILLDHIEKTLGEEWVELLAWPKQVIRGYDDWAT